MNSFGQSFRLSIYGESHGPGLGVLIDGLPPGIRLDPADFEAELDRRKPGAKGTTARKEVDRPQFLSGVFKGHSTGAPLNVYFENRNVRSKDYEHLRRQPRPGHADFTAWKKYGGFNDYRGGGHFSGRLTLALVAAGVVAKKLIGDIGISAKLVEAGGSTDIEAAVKRALDRGDSIGGLIECTAAPMPVGLGEPFFDSLESAISHIVFSIPAIKGIEFGSGFRSANMYGSEHNDPIVDDSGKTESNHAGGINGGISNGNPLLFRVAVKPPSSIPATQQTFDFDSGKKEKLEIRGRHDACIALRAPVVIEAVTAIVLADMTLRNFEF